MADNIGNRTADYTYIWRIENYTRPPHLNVQSPPFIVDSIEKTKWRLVLHVNQHCVLCYVKRLADNSELKSMELDFELTVLAADGSQFKEQRGAYFHINHRSKIVKLIDNSVFNERRAEFLPKDTLTIRCQIWKKESNISVTDLCFARTQLRLVRRSFLWPVEEFSSFLPQQKRSYDLQPTTNREPRMTLNLFLDNDDLRAEISTVGGKCCSINGDMSMVDIEGRVICRGTVGFWYQNLHQTNTSFPPLMSKHQLMARKSQYLPNDVLLFRCFFHIFLGIQSSRIEYCSKGVSSKNSDDTDDSFDFDRVPVSCPDSCSLKKALKSLYEEGTYSDVTLRAGGESFPVHKNILSVRCPMFKAMFCSDMVEKDSSTIDLPDLDGATLRRLLLYIYTNTLENIHWEDAFDLFRAADECGLVDLKKRCSALMTTNLSEANVCEILHVADMHQDEHLTLAAKDFIYQRNVEFFDSKDWKLFKSNNEELASETWDYVCLVKG